MKKENNKERKTLDLEQRHIIIQRRYDALVAINDLLIAIWFLVGSFFFLSDSFKVEINGTWLFIIGSAQLFISPTIKLFRLFHVKHIYDKNLKQK